MNNTITKKEMTSIIRELKTEQMDALAEMRYNILQTLLNSNTATETMMRIEQQVLASVETVILIADKREDGEDE